jgi:small subunit ribosomal protein S9
MSDSSDDRNDDIPRDDSELGEVNPQPEIAAEDASGAQEQPTPRQQEREQAIVDEPVAESEQLIGEATAPSPADAPGASPADAEAPADPPTAGPEPAVEDLEEDEDETPRVKPAIPGMDLEVDIVPEGEDALRSDEDDDDDSAGDAGEEDLFSQPIAEASIDLAAGARYRATGKRKTAVARVILRPGTGAYVINGKDIGVYFPRATLQRNIRQPLETVGYEDRMDVVALMHGGGVSAQAGALRHGISRALLEADPNLRSELKRRGFLTRDARAKERKKAGLKKARKKPQFSKR